jgi:hypothetical protein
MAYGLKYTLLCLTRLKNLYKAKIYFEGYSGPEIDRDVPIRPFRLRKDKSTTIKGTSFEYSIREKYDFEFLEFYTNSTKKIKVELCDGNDELIWVGYNLPQQYQVPYVPSPCNVSFSASDGLGLLKKEPFTLSGRNSQFDILRYCIDKIGLGLGYSIGIHLWHSSHNQERTPLEQTFENAEVYSDLNCYEVIEQILQKYNAEITQASSRWLIYRKKDIKLARLLYSTDGVFEGTTSGPAIISLGQMGREGVQAWPKGSLNMSIEPGASSVIIKHDFGRRSSFFPNPPNNWTIPEGLIPEIRYNENGSYIFLPGRNDLEQFIFNTISVVNVPGEDFVFSLKMAAVGSRLYGGIPIPIPMNIKMFVQLSNGIEARWLMINDDNKTAEWTTTPYTISRINNSVIGGEPRFNELRAITKELPFDGNMTVFLGRYNSMDGINDSNWTIDGVAFADLYCQFVKNGQLYPRGEENKVTFVNSTEPNDLGTIDIRVCDSPDLPNSILLYKNITYLGDGTPT